jgi:hypothetical protein
VENAIASATLAGPEEVRSLDQMLVFNWLGKIFYGLLHRELFLLFNRQAPDDGTITTPELLKQFQLLHYFIQNVRVPIHFEGGFPASIFIYETKVPTEQQYQWDFRDNLTNLFISVRMGRVGIVAVLQDGGAQEVLRNELEQLLVYPLHPIQHLEVCAMVCYKALLATRTPKYIISDVTPIRVIQLPLAGLSTKPLFQEWHPPTYAQVLSEFLHVPLEMLIDEHQRVKTWLLKPDGTPNNIDFDQLPWPPDASSV